MSNDATTQDQYQYFHYFTVSSFLKQIILFNVSIWNYDVRNADYFLPTV